MSAFWTREVKLSELVLYIDLHASHDLEFAELADHTHVPNILAYSLVDAPNTKSDLLVVEIIRLLQRFSGFDDRRCRQSWKSEK